jgi:hypothetical protein
MLTSMLIWHNAMRRPFDPQSLTLNANTSTSASGHHRTSKRVHVKARSTCATGYAADERT